MEVLALLVIAIELILLLEAAWIIGNALWAINKTLADGKKKQPPQEGAKA